MTTTTTLDTPAPAPEAPAATAANTGRIRLSPVGLLRSEWIKLRSLRSTWWSFGLVVASSLVMAALMSSTLDLQGAGSTVPVESQTLLFVQAATFGVLFSQLIVAVLGVLTITGEYSTGMIKSTLTAAPGRFGALGAKIIVLFLATFVVGVISTVGAFLVASAVLSRQDISANLFSPDVFLPLLGGALYLGLMAVFALFIGTIVRNGAGGIAAVLGIVLLLPMVLQLIPAVWTTNALPYLISNAGVSMFGLMQFSAEPISAGANLLVVLGWILAALIPAVVLLKRRDA